MSIRSKLFEFLCNICTFIHHKCIEREIPLEKIIKKIDKIKKNHHFYILKRSNKFSFKQGNVEFEYLKGEDGERVCYTIESSQELYNALACFIRENFKCFNEDAAAIRKFIEKVAMFTPKVANSSAIGIFTMVASRDEKEDDKIKIILYETDTHTVSVLQKVYKKLYNKNPEVFFKKKKDGNVNEKLDTLEELNNFWFFNCSINLKGLIVGKQDRVFFVNRNKGDLWDLSFNKTVNVIKETSSNNSNPLNDQVKEALNGKQENIKKSFLPGIGIEISPDRFGTDFLFYMRGSFSGNEDFPIFNEENVANFLTKENVSLDLLAFMRDLLIIKPQEEEAINSFDFPKSS